MNFYMVKRFQLCSTVKNLETKLASYMDHPTKGQTQIKVKLTVVYTMKKTTNTDSRKQISAIIQVEPTNAGQKLR